MYMGIQNNLRTLHSLQLYQVCYCNTLNICNVILIVGLHTTTIITPVPTTSPQSTDSRPSSKFYITIVVQHFSYV